MARSEHQLDEFVIPIDTVYREWLIGREAPERKQMLAPPLLSLLDRMNLALERNLADERDFCLKTLLQMEKVYTPDLVVGRIELERGRGLMAKGDLQEAEKCFRQAAQKYRPYYHEYAIANYFLGYLLARRMAWEEAFRAWKFTQDNFKQARENGTGNQAEADWYSLRLQELERMLIALIEIMFSDDQKSRADQKEEPPALPISRGVTAVTEKVDWGYLLGLPVLDEVPAGGFRGGDFTKYIGEELVISAIQYNGKTHRFYSLSGHQQIHYHPRRDFFLKVKGNSMNRAFPRSIEDGDLVLVTSLDLALTSSEYYGRQNPAALEKLSSVLDQRIVVAEISSQAEVARTLKRCRIEGGRIWLYPESSDPVYQPIELRPENPDETLGISGVVIAVLKPET